MMKKQKPIILAIFLSFIFLISLIFVSAEETTCIYFFHGEGCQHCARAEPAIRNLEIQSEFPVEIHRLEIYNDRSNLLLLNELFDNYNISNNQRGVPVVFIGHNYLIGDEPIINNIYRVAKENLGAECPVINGKNATGTAGKTAPLEKLGALSLLIIVGAALVDSINPCAIAVLLILLGALLAAGNRFRVLKAGLAFTLSIYIAYFLFGLGLFSAIQISGISYWFYKTIGALAIIVGLANIKDYFWYGAGGFVMEIPRNWRPALKCMLSRVTSPLGAFLMGFVVCLFELPCTGGPYIVILGLLAERMTMYAAIPLLLLYNLVFVLPLLIITSMIYFGFANVENATQWKEKNIRILHLVAGLIMTALGVLIVFGLV